MRCNARKGQYTCRGRLLSCCIHLEPLHHCCSRPHLTPSPAPVRSPTTNVHKHKRVTLQLQLRLQRAAPSITCTMHTCMHACGNECSNARVHLECRQRESADNVRVQTVQRERDPRPRSGPSPLPVTASSQGCQAHNPVARWWVAGGAGG